MKIFINFKLLIPALIILIFDNALQPSRKVTPAAKSKSEKYTKNSATKIKKLKKKLLIKLCLFGKKV